MNIGFTGKIALVTGASRGIGCAIVEQIAKCGAARVYALCRNPSDMAELCDKYPTVIEAVACDLSQAEQIDTAIGKLPLTVQLLVNCAGAIVHDTVGEITVGQLDEMMNVNCKAALLLAQAVYRKLGDNNKRGVAIVNVSSIAAIQAVPHACCYAASKAALDSLTRSMAIEWAAGGVRVNSVNPTVVMTDMTERYWRESGRLPDVLRLIPGGRAVDVAEVVNVVCFLLSDLASGINGSCIRVDLGQLSGYLA